MVSQSRETAFHPITSAKAAGFMEEAGWLWVTNYGDVRWPASSSPLACARRGTGVVPGRADTL
jgi:hypothetical protein